MVASIRMPDPSFKGDPYAVLGVAHGASLSDIKRRWRDLAREHHPDRAIGEGGDTRQLTTRMARINAAYDLLRDSARRARYDASPAGRRAAASNGRGAASEAAAWDENGREPRPGSYGPPPAPPTRPVTARFDTTAAYLSRNSTTSRERSPLPGHQPISRRRPERDLRASTPTGPVQRRAGARPRAPSLEASLATLLEFGRFHGFTLGEVADLEPTYIDWIARTITRDRELVMKARVVQADLDERGVERSVGASPQPGFGRAADEAAEARYDGQTSPAS